MPNDEMHQQYAYEAGLQFNPGSTRAPFNKLTRSGQPASQFSTRFLRRASFLLFLPAANHLPNADTRMSMPVFA
ncbi:MAG: hypothetical protein C0629_10985 [Chromatiales bacterium]|jgi:hypothetical protein|nr:MAG: hypothetical protein C0629_10985 [Chromatiales bacterium]